VVLSVNLKAAIKKVASDDQHGAGSPDGPEQSRAFELKTAKLSRFERYKNSDRPAPLNCFRSQILLDLSDSVPDDYKSVSLASGSDAS
jgi:hypothetical protein